jgi:hypothetical protein
MKDPEVQKEETVPNIASSESVSKGEGDEISAPSEDRGGAADAREGISPNIKLTQRIRGPL